MRSINLISFEYFLFSSVYFHVHVRDSKRNKFYLYLRNELLDELKKF